MTYGELINLAARRLKTAGVDSARLDSRLIIGHVTGLDQSALLSRRDDPVPADVIERAEPLIGKREKRQPLAQILGRREFWSLPFHVTPDTLIPRPDSETVIISALEWAGTADRPLRVLDLGCGTGCLLLALLSEWPEATGVGVDIEAAAVRVAEENAQCLGLDGRARFVRANWGEGVDGKFDVVVSNPPYVPEGDAETLAPEVVAFEPASALFGGADGLGAFRALSGCIGRLLAPGGGVFLEIGMGQEPDVSRIMAEAGFDVFERKNDLAGVVRCLTIHRRAPVDC